MDLGIRLEERGDWTIARVTGDLDLTTAPKLRERLVQVVVDGRPHIVLDLEGVDFVDSTGLGVVVGLLKRTRGQGGDLRLVSTRSGLRKILELTALDRALPLAASVDQALSEPEG